MVLRASVIGADKDVGDKRRVCGIPESRVLSVSRTDKAEGASSVLEMIASFSKSLG